MCSNTSVRVSTRNPIPHDWCLAVCQALRVGISELLGVTPQQTQTISALASLGSVVFRQVADLPATDGFGAKVRDEAWSPVEAPLDAASSAPARLLQRECDLFLLSVHRCTH